MFPTRENAPTAVEARARTAVTDLAHEYAVLVRDAAPGFGAESGGRWVAPELVQDALVIPLTCLSDLGPALKAAAGAPPHHRARAAHAGGLCDAAVALLATGIVRVDSRVTDLRLGEVAAGLPGMGAAIAAALEALLAPTGTPGRDALAVLAASGYLAVEPARAPVPPDAITVSG